MSAPADTLPAVPTATFAIGGDLEVFRLGFGAMRITGPGVWGEPADPAGVAGPAAPRRRA